ncbi:pilus assembly PilX family protein [Aquisalimonas asiatica]|uniref:Type IV pilus assembly protein PilX n=1 Tax=Aquisalimonas asiatica TaxID=406100 RepID=A0A1H8S2M0_9GAMM|nr:PilX N-terminal domain-containing pilus assembly protein [Aquisalimonas asiatica]SEO72941.1 type IV pilus assembly protein PilX [Aquisalimonas asiatica]
MTSRLPKAPRKNPAPRMSQPRWNAQRGAVLVVSLVLLAVMTLIGVFAMRGTTLEERMAGNLRDRDMAFQAAEGALREAEREFSRSMALQDPTSDSWEDRLDQGFEYTPEASGNFQLAAPAQYVIEEFPPEADLEGRPLGDDRRYRVTARAVGGSTEAVVVLQTEFRR